MGTYSNPGGPSGMLPDDSKKEEKTTTDPGQLGYHENSHKGMVDLTNAMNNSNPGNGPMKNSTAGTYNFSSGFSLGGSKSGDFANKHISGLKSSISDTKNPTSSYNQAEQKWEEAGMHRTTLHGEGDAVYHTKGTNKSYGQRNTNWTDIPEENQGGIHATSKYIEDKGGFEGVRAEFTQGTDAKIFKTETGAIIENIPGEYGKTRDRAIIHRKPSSDKSKSTVKKEGVPTGSYVMRAGGATAGEDERLSTKENRQDLRSRKQTDRRAEKRLKSATKASEKRNKPTRKEKMWAKIDKKNEKGLTKALKKQAKQDKDKFK
jgi:hypothetical protein